MFHHVADTPLGARRGEPELVWRYRCDGFECGVEPNAERAYLIHNENNASVVPACAAIGARQWGFVPTWSDAAEWYLEMVRNPQAGFNDLASDVAVDLVGACDGFDILDLGCGEGHIARRLARQGGRVVAVEPVEVLLADARRQEERSPLGIRYELDTAEHLVTVDAASIDVTIAVLVLHHVEDLSGALREVCRVLRPGGRLVAVTPHPWSDHQGAAWLKTDGGERRVIGRYCDEGYWTEGDTAPGAELRSVRQIGWYHRTIATWLTSVASAGFVIERALEPVAHPDGDSDDLGGWSAVPRFFAFTARVDTA